MKKSGFALLLLLAGCAVPTTPVDDFTGHWSGSLTGDYNCTDSTTQQVTFMSEGYDISQSGTSASISVAYCSGLVLDGTASGNELDLSATADTALACLQTGNAGINVTINDFSGGIFTLEKVDGGTALGVSLDEDIAITDPQGNAHTCSGTVMGTLSL